MEFKESKQVIKENEHCAASSSSSSSSSINDDSLSSDLSDDASSSSTTSCNNSSSASSNGPLYELADLMAQLPIKRGLSKFYNGRSQTFGSLSDVKSVEDLGKREMSHNTRMKMKSCRNLNIHHKFAPKPTIAKRSTKTSSCLSSFATKTSLFIIHG